MSGRDLELEERLHRLAPAFKDGLEPPATLHVTVMSATAAPRSPAQRPSMLRELSLAAALVVFVALLAFGFSKLHGFNPAPVKPSPHPTATAIPWTPAPMVLLASSAQRATPAEAAAFIGHTVLTVDPLLVPGAIGDDYQAELLADVNGFAVDYMSSTRHATVELATFEPAMAGPGANGLRTTRSFRGVEAIYQVDDATATAPRSLLWTEPSANRGVPYSLNADGLAESEFWQLANSLHALTPAAQLRPCVATDLQAATGRAGAATGGQLYNSIVFSNHSSTPCRLDGTPRLQLITASGSTLALPQSDGPTPWAPNAPGVVMMDAGAPAPAPTAGQENPAGQASVTFIMYDCPGPAPALSRIAVALPGGRGSISVLAGSGVAFSGGFRCEGNANVHSIGVSPFSGLGPQPTWVESSPLSITLRLPDHVRAGQTLRYEVSLTNSSRAPLKFHDCPSYTEDASRPGHKNLANYQLNCSSVRWLAPDESATFAMVLDIPADTPPGPGRLRWEMRSTYGNGEGNGTLTVTAP
jgi:hypothetical protein